MRKRPLIPHPDNPLWMLVPLGGRRGGFAVIDIQDAEEVGRHNWCPTDGGNTFYATHGTRRDDGQKTTETLHQIIAASMGIVGEVDHKNRDGLDCRRSNLRAATHQQNMFNRGIGRNNTSGVAGVVWREFYNQWEARVQVSGKQHFLGRYTDLAEAKVVVERAREQLHGEFACVG